MTPLAICILTACQIIPVHLKFVTTTTYFSGSDDDSAPVEKRAPTGRRAAASKKVTYSQSSESEGDLFG